MNDDTPSGLVTGSADAAGQVADDVARIWARVLGVPNVGRDDNFLLLGGESLLATQVAADVRERFGCEVSIRSILVGTVAEVAAEIAAAERPALT